MALTEFPAVSCKQRLRAARRLAAGDPLVLAAVYAGMTPEELDRLQFDPDFTDLIDACRQLHALDHAAWRARIELLMRDSVEDALQENRVSTLNTLLRGAERHPAEVDADEADEDADDAPPPRRPFAEADPAREAARQRALGRMGPMLRGLVADDPLDTLVATFPHYARAAKLPRQKAPAPAPAEADVPRPSPPEPPAPADAAAVEPAPQEVPPAVAPDAVTPAVGSTEAAATVPAIVPTAAPAASPAHGSEAPGEPAPAAPPSAAHRPAAIARPPSAGLKNVPAERRIDQATAAWLASEGFPHATTQRGWRSRLVKVAEGP